MMKKWIRRRRNSLGYGVQSPSDFYFVQHVLREKSPYYAYTALKEMATISCCQSPSHTAAEYKLFFRLANHVHPRTIIGINTGLSIFAMAMGCPSAQCIAITASAGHSATMHAIQANHPQVEIRNGDEMQILEQLIREQQTIDLLHIAHTSHLQAIIDAALPYTTDRTLFIVEGIAESREKRDWWDDLRKSSLTGISYDLGAIGLLFFDHTRHKKSYWINLRE